MINRFSSRTARLDQAFLNDRLGKAKSYHRIAGYFSSSIFELVGEELSGIDEIKIVCNSELDPRDIETSKRHRDIALRDKFTEGGLTDVAFYQSRYKKLFELLTDGRLQIRVVARDDTFLHGKAGVIESRDGKKTSFLGSINETKAAFSSNYEILWEDDSPEAVAWVEEEFAELWKRGHDLPDAVIQEVKRRSNRVEVRFEDLSDEQVPASALVESPMYRGGEGLQPWQRSFVSQAISHRETYGKARLLLADEVGLGKTLSLGVATMTMALLGDGKVLILCPASLRLQWQTELTDRLGIPSAVWLTQKKSWLDSRGYIIKANNPEAIANCPNQIGIVSTGLMMQETREKEILSSLSYGTIVLDEAHRARSTGNKFKPDAPRKDNNLLTFMKEIAPRTKNLLLGTATPIQIDVGELWDLLEILDIGSQFVLGGNQSYWKDYNRVLPVIGSKVKVVDERELWEYVRNPLPIAAEGELGRKLRSRLDIESKTFKSNVAYVDLKTSIKEMLRDGVVTNPLQDNNPLTRHIILRRRADLEKKGLLDRVGVEVHPNRDLTTNYQGLVLIGNGLVTNEPFRIAYEAAESFSNAYAARVGSGGFGKSIFLQRICSSFTSGLLTASRILEKRDTNDAEVEEESIAQSSDPLSPLEEEYLNLIIEQLSSPAARDTKLDAVKYFLTEHYSDGKIWLEHGCIIFSSYYDTVSWLASELSKLLLNEPIGVYAGQGKSALLLGGKSISISREEIKERVKNHELRLVVATDAASEGLNLQKLGTLINVDLPWNPARLEQRLGRIKRFGQSRSFVDMANLVYHDTQDEKVYEVISKRLKDKFDIFGGIPDTINDGWIEDIETYEKDLDKYIERRDNAEKQFELKPQDFSETTYKWELVEEVLSEKDIAKKLGESW